MREESGLKGFDILFWVFTNPSILTLMIFILLIAFVIIFVMQIKNNNKTLVVSILMGLIVGFFYLILTSLLDSNQENLNSVNSIYLWLSLTTIVFMIGILFVIPFYLFSMISTTFINTRHNKNGKLIFISFISLLAMTFLGIVIAISFFPLIFLLKDFIQVPVSDSSSTGIFGGIWPEFENFIGEILLIYGYIVISVIILAIIFSIVMNVLHKYKHDIGESLISGIMSIKEFVRNYLKWFVFLVPFVIFDRIVILFSNYENIFLETLSFLMIFIIFFFLGLIIIWLIEYFIVLILRKNKKELSTKKLNSYTKEYAINDFAIQSAPVLYPITLSYVEKLGVEKEVLKTTPTLSTFMGYSMCGGFYPALVIITTLIQESTLSSLTLNFSISLSIIFLIIFLIMIPLIMISTLGMTGVPGADVAIIISLLSTLRLNPQYFFTIYLIEPLLDKFRGVGNSMGFAAASVITNSIYLSNKDKNNSKIEKGKNDYEKNK